MYTIHNMKRIFITVLALSIIFGLTVMLIAALPKDAHAWGEQQALDKIVDNK